MYVCLSAQMTRNNTANLHQIFMREDSREDVRNKSCLSGVSARMSRGCYEETAVVEFRL